MEQSSKTTKKFIEILLIMVLLVCATILLKPSQKVAKAESSSFVQNATKYVKICHNLPQKRTFLHNFLTIPSQSPTKNDKIFSAIFQQNLAAFGTQIKHQANQNLETRKFGKTTTDPTQQEAKYAKAKEGCLFYQSESCPPESALFEIPESYFVRVVESGTVLKVIYLDRVGYLLPESARMVSIEPQEPYLQPFEIQTKSDSGTQLRLLPTTNSSAIALVPQGSTITYIASIEGEKPASGTSSKWFFVQYSPPSNPTSYYEGYIYSERIFSMPTIAQNTEDDPALSLPLVLPEQEKEAEQEKDSPAYLKGILIAVLCLPAFLFAAYITARIISKQRPTAF